MGHGYPSLHWKQTFSPEDVTLKDVWFFVEDGNDCVHMFFMARPGQGRKSPASLGYAVNQRGDLLDWKYVGTAVAPSGKRGASNLEATLATGCCLKKEKTYYLFYTQRPFLKSTNQRIGLAVSQVPLGDLEWVKSSKNPILEANNVLYATDYAEDAKDALGLPSAFRDPFVFPDGTDYWMVFTSRDHRLKGTYPPHEPYDGCVGLARATAPTLDQWELEPPILSPQRYVEMEVPEIRVLGDRHYLFFSTQSKGNRYSWLGEPGGLYCYFSSSGIHGPYSPVNEHDHGLVVDLEGLRREFGFDVYGIKLVRRRGSTNSYDALGWIDMTCDGTPIKRLSPPLVIEINGDTIDWHWR